MQRLLQLSGETLPSVKGAADFIPHTTEEITETEYQNGDKHVVDILFRQQNYYLLLILFA